MVVRDASDSSLKRWISISVTKLGTYPAVWIAVSAAMTDYRGRRLVRELALRQAQDERNADPLAARGPLPFVVS